LRSADAGRDRVRDERRRCETRTTASIAGDDTVSSATIELQWTPAQRLAVERAARQPSYGNRNG
jgi:hypothetical protein